MLSNNDGCSISRSAEAKALGLAMCAPYFQVKELMRQYQVLSSNYALYGDLIRRVTWYLGQVTPGVEIYSIDEVFLDLAGLDTHMKPYLGGVLEAFAHTISC
jgi:DNA polymerase V